MNVLHPLFLADEGLHTRHYLSQLLPYDPIVKIDDRLEAGLIEFLLLLTASEETMIHLQNGTLKYFDPLVGENFCQIRAVKLALTIQNSIFDTKKLLDSIIHSKSKIEHAISNLSKINKRKVSLNHLLENEGCDISINEAEYYLISSYILTKTKVLRSSDVSKPLVKNDITDSKKIKELGNVGSLFAKNFVTHLRRQLSSSSVKFVQRLSENLSPENPTVKMVSQEFLADHNGLHCIPCYWSTRIALQQAQHHCIPIVMHVQQKAKDHDYKIVDKTTILFEVTPDGYQVSSHSHLDPESPALILLGTTCRNLKDLPDRESWIKELLEYCPVELVSAYAAAHRQYPDESKDLLFCEIQDRDYNYHKMKANEWGCSIENPSLFFLAHAYCDKIKNLENF
jgi:hypothetical protein